MVVKKKKKEIKNSSNFFFIVKNMETFNEEMKKVLLPFYLLC